MAYFCKRKRGIKRSFIVLFVILFIFLSALLTLNTLLSPLLKNAAIQKARSVSTYIISTAVMDITDNSNYDYSNITVFEKDTDGRIAAIRTDMVKMNRLRAEIAVKIHDRLGKAENSKISIPIGSVLGNGIFNGMGPDIKLDIRQSGAVITDFENVFTSAGINQTNHRIMVNVKVSFYILMPFEFVKEQVTASVCVAENVIVGNVPEAFTNVQNSADTNDETIADEIVDFGAHNYSK